MTHHEFTISVDPNVLEVDVEQHVFEIALNQRGPAGVDGQDGADSTVPGPQGDPGQDGTDGEDGTDGADGAPGSVWRNGSGAPSNGLGIDGDYYLDDATGNVYFKAAGTYSIVSNIEGPQGDPGTDGTDGAPGSDGEDGEDGSDGAPGSVWREGTGIPDDGLGVDGDFYLDDVFGDVYLKAAGAYSIVANIKGEQGDPGADGLDGSLYGLTPTSVKTSNYTAAAGEMVLVDLSGGDFNVQLPGLIGANTSLVDHRKRVGVKFVATSTLNFYQLTVQCGFSTEGNPAFLSPPVGTYIEFEWDANYLSGNGGWNRVSEIDFPLQQWISAIAGDRTLLPNHSYLVQQDFGSDFILTLPIGGQAGDRIGVKLLSNSNQKLVRIDPPVFFGIEDNANQSAGGGLLPIRLTRSFEYVEFQWMSPGWMIAHRDLDALIRDASNAGGGMSIRTADFTCLRETSYRFYTNVSSGTRTITMPKPLGSGGTSLFYGDRVELIAIGHGNDRVTVDGNGNNIEFSRAQKVSSATFNSNGFYMLLEWCKGDGNASFGGSDCWTVIESSVGKPGSRIKYVATSTDMTAEINTIVGVDVSSNPVTITLPSHAEGDTLTIKNGASTANTLTVDGNGTNIDGSTPRTITVAYEWMVLVSNGSEWMRVG